MVYLLFAAAVLAIIGASSQDRGWALMSFALAALCVVIGGALWVWD